MPNFIGRKRKIGIGKETTAGTAVAATDWMPLTKPGFKPVSEKAVDSSAYGNIDEIYSKETTKNMTEVSVEGIVRDGWSGLLLLASLGSESLCVYGILSTVTGTFVVGETVTGGTSGATGTVKRLEGTTIMYITVLTSTFTSGETITGGTSSATATLTYDTTARAHIFERLNTNAHPTFTLVKSDDVDTQNSSYCMLDKIDLETAVGDFSKFVAVFKGKQMTTTTATSSYVAANAFLAKYAKLYFADTVALLSAASETPISRAKVSIAKNLTDYQAWGDDDIASIHNQQFGVSGDLDALFSDVTLRDYMVNSTKKAMRIKMVNTDITIGAATHPTLIIELSRVSFESWDDSAENNALVKQTIGFVGEFSTTDSNTILAILINNRVTAY